ncbi:MAG: hypothetical protein PWP10_4102 [Clostridiales bacterium]|jgi:YesN/AraC family two-component response regulator|nr:hypothetical protein [Clostridiales bacterium]
MNTDLEQKMIRERLKNTYRSFQHPSYLLEQRLNQAIIASDKQGALAILDQINSLERAELAPSPLRSLKNSIIGSCTMYTRACIAGGVDSETAFMLSDLYIRQIEQITNSVEAEKLEYDMLIAFIDLVNENSSPKYSPPIRKTMSYIQHHIQLKLTLADVASYVGIHPNYLCSLFKAETGQSIMQVYDQERCEAIKRFLSHTNISLTDIADNFDFSSVSYFSSYFKKQTGISPSEYRKKHQNDQLLEY